MATEVVAVSDLLVSDDGAMVFVSSIDDLPFLRWVGGGRTPSSTSSSGRGETDAVVAAVDVVSVTRATAFFSPLLLLLLLFFVVLVLVLVVFSADFANKVVKSGLDFVLAAGLGTDDDGDDGDGDVKVDMAPIDDLLLRFVPGIVGATSAEGATLSIPLLVFGGDIDRDTLKLASLAWSSVFRHCNDGGVSLPTILLGGTIENRALEFDGGKRSSSSSSCL